MRSCWVLGEGTGEAEVPLDIRWKSLLRLPGWVPKPCPHLMPQGSFQDIYVLSNAPRPTQVSFPGDPCLR